MAQATFRSWNTFGGMLWTDGKIEAPMLPNSPWLVKCPHCQSLLWIDEQVELEEGKLDCWRICEKEQLPEKRHFKKSLFGYYETGIPQCLPPSADDLFAYLDTNVLDVEKERYLRQRAWWAGNDIRRKGKKKYALSDNETRNLEALAELLDESDNNDRIIKAEIMRELGRFDDAVSVLAMSFDKESVEAVTVIKELAQRKYPFVAKITHEDQTRIESKNE